MVKDIFEYDDYRAFMRDYIESLPKRGFGQLSKTAQALNIQPSLLTGILNGSKNLTQDQAFDYCAHIGLTDLESEHFIALVHLERAGTERVRSYYRKKIKDVRSKSELLKNRLPPQAELPEQVKAQFYSEWYYSAIRMATSLEARPAPEEIAQLLGVSRQTVIRVLEFLMANNLVKLENDRYVIGPQSTHIGSGEPLVTRHHTNWRLKAIEKYGEDLQTGLHFTSPVSLSTEDFVEVKKILARSLEQVFDRIDPSPAQELACLTIDWFKIKSRHDT